MTCIRPPYFLTNRDWYTTPEDEGIEGGGGGGGRGYHIKDDAPEEAKQSYIDFYAEDPDFPGIHFH